MTNLQKIALRQSEIRTRLHDLGAVEDLTDEIRGEIGTLTTEMKDLEIRSQAAIAAGEAPDVEPVGEPGDEQLYDLARRANAGEVFDAALEHRSTDGATRELQDELNLAMNQLPMMLLETRAVTPAPANVPGGSSGDHTGRLPGFMRGFPGRGHADGPGRRGRFPRPEYERGRGSTGGERSPDRNGHRFRGSDDRIVQRGAANAVADPGGLFLLEGRSRTVRRYGRGACG